MVLRLLVFTGMKIFYSLLVLLMGGCWQFPVRRHLFD